MNQKNNQRFQETDKRIRDFFVKSLEEKNISQITVREICESVGINRSSFYLHYQDIYAVLEAVCTEVGKEMFEDFNKAALKSDIYFSKEYLMILLQHVRKYYPLYRAYMENVGMQQIEKGYQILFTDVFKPYFRRIGIESEHRMEYHFQFVKAGFFAVVRRWMQYNCEESPEEMVEIIFQTIAPIPEGLSGMEGI